MNKHISRTLIFDIGVLTSSSYFYPLLYKLVPKCYQLHVRKPIADTKIGHSVSQTVSHQPLSAEAELNCRAVHMGFVVHKVALGQVSSPPGTSILLVSVIPPMLHMHSHTCHQCYITLAYDSIIK